MYKLVNVIASVGLASVYVGFMYSIWTDVSLYIGYGMKLVFSGICTLGVAFILGWAEAIKNGDL
jgi:hypothetical protein